MNVLTAALHIQQISGGVLSTPQSKAPKANPTIVDLKDKATIIPSAMP